MARILILAVVAVVLLGGVLAADQALSNPDMEPSSADLNTAQEEFAEATTPIFDAAPVLLLVLVVGAALAAIGRVG